MLVPSPSFFLSNGLSEDVVTYIAVAMNLGNVLVVLLSTCLMDRAGRRVLLLSSMAGMFLAVVLLTFALVQGMVRTAAQLRRSCQRVGAA